MKKTSVSKCCPIGCPAISIRATHAIKNYCFFLTARLRWRGLRIGLFVVVIDFHEKNWTAACLQKKMESTVCVSAKFDVFSGENIVFLAVISYKCSKRKRGCVIILYLRLSKTYRKLIIQFYLDTDKLIQITKHYSSMEGMWNFFCHINHAFLSISYNSYLVKLPPFTK